MEVFIGLFLVTAVIANFILWLWMQEVFRRRTLVYENTVLRDLLKSAVHGQQVLSEDGEYLARLVNDELVIEAWQR